MYEAFTDYRRGMLGLAVSHMWRGYGSAVFLEFGTLTERIRRDGSVGNPEGEFGLMIEWSWRIETEHKIRGGSWSDDTELQPLIFDLVGRTVEDVTLFGRIPEVAVALSGNRYLLSFMTAEGDPEWAIFDRRGISPRALHVKDGRLCKKGVERDAGSEADFPDVR